MTLVRLICFNGCRLRQAWELPDAPILQHWQKAKHFPGQWRAWPTTSSLDVVAAQAAEHDPSADRTSHQVWSGTVTAPASDHWARHLAAEDGIQPAPHLASHAEDYPRRLGTLPASQDLPRCARSLRTGSLPCPEPRPAWAPQIDHRTRRPRAPAPGPGCRSGPLRWSPPLIRGA